MRILRVTLYFEPQLLIRFYLFTSSSSITAMHKDIPVPCALSMLRTGLFRLNQLMALTWSALSSTSSPETLTVIEVRSSTCYVNTSASPASSTRAATHDIMSGSKVLVIQQFLSIANTGLARSSTPLSEVPTAIRRCSVLNT